MKRGSKLVAGPQSVGLVRNSLWGASAETNNQAFKTFRQDKKKSVTEIVLNKILLNNPPWFALTTSLTGNFLVLQFPCKPAWIPGGWQDVSVLGLEDLLLEEVLLV